MSVKKHITDTMKRLYKNNYISIRDGNVSFKPKNENYFYISAGSVKKNEINEDQIIKVHFEGNKLFYNKDYKYQPSREISMHSLLQSHKSNLENDTFVVHAHPPNIIRYIGTKESKELNTIKTVFPELNVGKIGTNVKYYEAGSLSLASNCFNNLINNDIVGLERHGSLSIGDDIDKIFEDIETLEYYIKIER
jgi:ribulose-5-phosphate 4-epimerase/fuculose-1-phosphate aldolase